MKDVGIVILDIHNDGCYTGGLETAWKDIRLELDMGRSTRSFLFESFCLAGIIRNDCSQEG